MKYHQEAFSEGRIVRYQLVKAYGEVFDADGKRIFGGSERECLVFLRELGDVFALNELRRQEQATSREDWEERD